MENFKTFSHTTSVKGIPKIVKSKLVSSKILWITATVACLAVAGYNVYYLCAGYLDRQTITTITERQRTSPDPYLMTVLACDNQPYNLNLIQRLGLPTPLEYYMRLQQVLSEKHPGTETETLSEEDIHRDSELFSPLGYRQYLTKEELAKLSKAQTTLVVSCQYLRRMGLFTQSVDCNRSNMMIEKTTVPGYFNCYVLENKLAAKDASIMGLELLLYMEGVNKPTSLSTEDSELKISLRNFQKIGVTILVIPYGTAQVEKTNLHQTFVQGTLYFPGLTPNSPRNKQDMRVASRKQCAITWESRVVNRFLGWTNFTPAPRKFQGPEFHEHTMMTFDVKCWEFFTFRIVHWIA